MASFLRQHASKVVLGVVALAGVSAYSANRPAKPTGTPAPNPLKTPGVQNIEGAYQKGGATSTHTKAYGGTTLGSKDDVMKDNGGTARPRGFDDHPGGTGDEQRPDAQRKGKIGEAFDE